VSRLASCGRALLCRPLAHTASFGRIYSRQGLADVSRSVRLY
jgi:hypothetical protein